MKAELIAGLPPGDAGTFTTLRMIAQMARRPAPSVRELAGELTAGAPPRVAVLRLFRFVRDQIANSEDPPGIEWLQAPHVTLEHPAGDCDDKAALLGALLVAAGFPVRLVAIGIEGRALRHVFVEAKVASAFGAEWVALDPKNPRAYPGWAYPWPARVERMEV